MKSQVHEKGQGGCWGSGSAKYKEQHTRPLPIPDALLVAFFCYRSIENLPSCMPPPIILARKVESYGSETSDLFYGESYSNVITEFG